MPKKDPIKRVLFENGAVGFISERSDFALSFKDGGEIKKVDTEDLSESERKAIDLTKPRMLKAEKKGKGWKVREKSTQELVDEKILTPEEGEKRDRKQFKNR